MKAYLTIACVTFCHFLLPAQDTLSIGDKLKVGYEAYVDFHYSYDFDRPFNRIRKFDSNPEYVNQFGLAYTYGQVYFDYGKFRAKVAVHAGDIVDIMYIDEEAYVFKLIRELSFTYQANDRLEIEMGIFPAVFGAETFINKDNLHATRAVMTDFAPDFETGFRMKYRLGEYWSGVAQITNGWQVVRDNNDSPGFGLVHVYDKPQKFLFNYGIFAGNEVYKSKNAMEQFKMYHNVFSRFYLGKWIIAPMFDIGMIKDPITNNMNYWHSYGGSVRYAVSPKWGVAARYERINDPDQIINDIITSTPNGFQMHGSTLTLEYLLNQEATFRLEGRHTLSKDPIFTTHNPYEKINNDFFIMLSIAIKFNHWGLVKVNKDPALKDQF